MRRLRGFTDHIECLLWSLPIKHFSISQVLSVFLFSDGDRVLESNQKNSKNQSIHLFWLLGAGRGELVLRLLPLKWFLFISALSSEWFGHDPDSDQDHLPEDRRRTELRELRSREISLIPHGSISREGEYWDYLIIICKIRTQRQDNPLASGWYFSVEWPVLIFHCVNFEGLQETPHTPSDQDRLQILGRRATGEKVCSAD